MTLAQWIAERDGTLLAIAAVRQGQSYTVQGALRGGGRSVTRADLADLQTYLLKCEQNIARLQRGGMRVRRGVTW